jgi:flagellar basal-body rod protein FlgB
MRTSLDTYLGIHPQALQLEAKRNELLAANLANVDTPNYKARDIDFKTALSAAGADSNAVSTSSSSTATLRTVGSAGATGATGTTGAQGAGVLSTAGAGDLDSSAVKYRVPMASALDGNTVDEQLEQSAFAENSVRYQASLQFINTALRDLMTAITGS